MFNQSLFTWIMVLLLAGFGTVFCQVSPVPEISGFGGAALDSAFALSDSTFCKGSILTIQGQGFINQGAGESWDTTQVWLGGYLSGLKCEVLGITANQSGNNDQLTFALLDVFPLDTCLVLDLVKIMQTQFGPIPYAFRDTICLSGDFVALAYPDTIFCLGDSNPLPSSFFSSNSQPNLCCTSGANGFFVLPSGEIPLHNGAVGFDNRFALTGSHPACPDTAWAVLDIVPKNVPLLTIQGGINGFCPDGTARVDTALIFPKGGRFVCHDPGLMVQDDSLGLLDLSQSLPGTYDLWYLPNEPCFDSAALSITIYQPDTANVIYPIAYNGLLQHLCANASTVSPLFLSGNAGGSFVSLPAGLALGAGGVIDPAASPPGSYTVMYHTTGNCPDTTAVSLNLILDSLLPSSFAIASSICSSVPALPVDSVLSPGTFELWLAGNLVLQTANPVIPIADSLQGGFTYEVAPHRGQLPGYKLCFAHG